MERGDRPDRRRACRSVRAVAMLLAAVVTSCSLDGLDFERDDRLHVEGLADREETDLPIELSWRFDGGFRDDEAAFAVIVDRTPPRPGRSVASLLEDDPACAGPQGCPEGYLPRNRMYITTDTSIVIDDVVEGTARQEDRGFHEITIVVVDAEGVRVGELAEAVRFRLPGRDA